MNYQVNINNMADLPTTELWFIDIRKYVYDTLVNYVPLIEKIGTNNVYFWDTNNSIAKKTRPFVSITQLWWNINSIWIREQEYQIDIFWTSLEQSGDTRDIIIDLLNRRYVNEVRSKLIRLRPDQSDEKLWIVRQSMDFLFVFKDMKF